MWPQSGFDSWLTEPIECSWHDIVLSIWTRWFAYFHWPVNMKKKFLWMLCKPLLVACNMLYGQCDLQQAIDHFELQYKIHHCYQLVYFSQIFMKLNLVQQYWSEVLCKYSFLRNTGTVNSISFFNICIFQKSPYYFGF